jgi:hypothetical protein
LFVRDADRVDPACEHGDGFQRRHVVRQQPAACAQLANRENESRLIRRRNGDAGVVTGQAVAAETIRDVGGVSAADERNAERLALSDVHSRQVTNAALSLA